MRTSITTEEVGSIANEALNAACQAIQERLGVKDGDVAGKFFSGHTDDKIVEIFLSYITAECEARSILMVEVSSPNYGTESTDYPVEARAEKEKI